MEPQTQEAYFAAILDRFTRLKDLNGAADGVEDALALLSLQEKAHLPESEKHIARGVDVFKRQNLQLDPASRELSILLMAMRKMREAIVASTRTDPFVLQVYTFIIRATILLKNMESYHPALLYLLQRIHPLIPLEKSDYHEFVGYFILDLACRQNDLAEAYRVKCHYKYRDEKVEAILKSLIHGNWYMFWALQKIVTPHQRSLMENAEDRIRKGALDCIGKSYLNVDRNFLGKSTQCSWQQVVDKYKLAWQLDGDLVWIRRISRK